MDRFYHHVYDPAADRWAPRAPLPTARSGHVAAQYRGKIVVMGGEGTSRVFGQNEGYGPQRDAIYVAGGGAVMGGEVQSAVHEALTLAQP